MKICLSLSLISAGLTTFRMRLHSKEFVIWQPPKQSETMWSNANKTTFVTAEVIFLALEIVSHNRPLLSMSNCQRTFSTYIPRFYVSNVNVGWSATADRKWENDLFWISRVIKATFRSRAVLAIHFRFQSWFQFNLVVCFSLKRARQDR